MLTGTAAIVVAALQLAGVLAPYALHGVEALIEEIRSAESSGKKLSFDEITDLASAHSVDLEHLASKLDDAR